MSLPEIEYRSRAGLRFEFQSITTLSRQLRQHIWDHMTWISGSMRFWLRDREPGHRLCLVYNSTLVTWACLKETKNKHQISAWTLDKYRKRGYAQAAIWALLNKERVSRNRNLIVYSSSTHRIVKRLGYKSSRNWCCV